MPRISLSRTTLRIIGDALDPSQITKALGAEPTLVRTKGELITRPNGLARVAETGIWNRTAPDCEPGDLDRQITDLLSQMTADLAVWRELSARFRCEMFCGLFLADGNEGIVLSAATLHLLAERGLSLDFDVYGPDLQPDSANGEI